MEAADWLNAAVNAVIGLLLGLVLHGLMQLVTDGAWGMALIVVMLGVAMLLLIYFDGLIGRLLDRIFPSGVRSAATPAQDDRKPLVRRLSLPAGLVLGVILALFGRADTILAQFQERPMSIRPVIETRRASPHIEGAGVHLHRAFGFQDPTEADPFLLFDDFRGDHPRDYSAGFPWHPHRGIETITYVLAGTRCS